MRKLAILTVSVLLAICLTLVTTASSAELQYSKAYCEKLGGVSEYRLPDRSRVDCLTERYAIEVEWPHKWQEAIGQAMYYSIITGKKPKIVILIRRLSDLRYVNRLLTVSTEFGIAVELVPIVNLGG